MRAAPNWHWQSDPVDGKWKQDLLIWLGSIFGMRTLVETGTCEASTPLAVHSHFDEIYSVELSPAYAEASRKNVAKWGLKNVRLSEGDSAPWLRKLLPAIPPEVPLLFWTDAHGSGSGTADWGEGLPHELAAIHEWCVEPLVVIDDANDGQGWIDTWKDSVPGWTLDFRCGEMILHKGGYVIPPFED